jgi:hypothetical protein
MEKNFWVRGGRGDVGTRSGSLGFLRSSCHRLGGLGARQVTAQRPRGLSRRRECIAVRGGRQPPPAAQIFALQRRINIADPERITALLRPPGRAAASWAGSSAGQGASVVLWRRALSLHGDPHVMQA